MVSRQSSSVNSSVNFRLKPLAASVRIIIASGMVIGHAHADLPIPVPGQGWVSSGSASSQVVGNTLRIDQKTDKAIMNWQKFNVGKENTVQFVQPSSTSVALNRIQDQKPSEIFGQIVANGQIYLYNKNGFVFGKDAVVNANSLIASTLNISDEVFDRGITQVFDDNGGAALAIEAKGNGDILDPKTVSILIEAGAKIHTDKAGRIIIAAPNITNKGSLSSGEQGQIILAASQDKVYLQAADSKSPFAGLLVEVDTGGKVENFGEVVAKQGNITMAGFAVNQSGRVTATTSVNLNGSIRLLAQEKHAKVGEKLIATETTRSEDQNDGLRQKATVNFKPNSVTEVVADADTSVAIDEQQQPQSLVEVSAHTVNVEANATLSVPGGKISVKASNNPQAPLEGKNQLKSGQIFVDQQAKIDVSGYKNVASKVQNNIAEISVQSYELRNAPLQLTGPLKGKTIKVDLRKGSKIVDTSGAAARVKRSIFERLSDGGSIDLTSSGDVIVNDGAQFDVSGGSIDYQGGMVETTYLVDDFGKIVSISDADPNQHYQTSIGEVLETHKKWGVEKSWTNSSGSNLNTARYEEGYSEGKSAGAISIKASGLMWDGDLSAAAGAGGTYQRELANTPQGGSFSIDLAVFNSVQNLRIQGQDTVQQLAEGSELKQTDGSLPDLVLSQSLLNQSGLSKLAVKTGGTAEVSEDVNINMVASVATDAQILDPNDDTGKTLISDPDQDFTLEARSINVSGDIRAAGGNINLRALFSSDTAQSGNISLTDTATLDVSGRWVNDYPGRFSAQKPVDTLNIDAGSIELTADSDVAIAAGASLSANAGAWQNNVGAKRYGNAGSLSLLALNKGSNLSNLRLDGRVQAFGFTQGGTLSLASSNIVIGTADANDPANSLVIAVSNGQFDFGKQLSFQTINLSASAGDLILKGDAQLNLLQRNLQLNAAALNQATGGSVLTFTDIVVLPDYLRKPLTLKLEAVKNLLLEAGSQLQLDMQSTVNLVSLTGSVYVNGLISSLGGEVNLQIAPKEAQDYVPSQVIWLGRQAQVLVQGGSRLNPLDALGHVTGEVFDGGSVSFNPGSQTPLRGYVVLEQGSLIDVSAAKAKLDLPMMVGNQRLYKRSTVGSDAGQVVINAAEGVVVDGEMRALSAWNQGQGGRFSLVLDRGRRKQPDLPTVAFPVGPLLINVRQTGEDKLSNSVFGNPLSDEFNGQATVDAQALMQAGFDTVELKTPDQINLWGDINWQSKNSLVFDTSIINAAHAATVNLSTGFLKLGSSSTRTVSLQPHLGTAKFVGNAQWIQLQGGVLWDQFASIDLRSQHDLRLLGNRGGDLRDFVGSMVTAASLNLQATQIYPATLTSFSFAIKNSPDGVVSISGSNTDATPLSAAGKLSIQAPYINQGGVLKAPLGTINLEAEKSLVLASGSLTSVSAEGLQIPFGVLQAGLDWLYPLEKASSASDAATVPNLVYAQPPSKQINLSASNGEVLLESGSQLDLSGGGDLLAYEFKPVDSSDLDFLDPDSANYAGSFAILPKLINGLAPFDYYQNIGWDYAATDNVHLSASDLLASGEYTILPAHFALLPGAFLITPQANSLDSVSTSHTVDGLPVVSGYFTQATTAARDARSSGFLIESREQMLARHPNYDVQLANQFFTAKANKQNSPVPLLPVDSGQVAISATTRLLLDGLINVSVPVDAAGKALGRGARMDIAANNTIEVVDQLSATPRQGVLEILDSQLNQLAVDSLLLGGTRQYDSQSGQTVIKVSADKVAFEEQAQLQAKDITVVANDSVEIKQSASISASGTVNTGDSVFKLKGDGALLRVSADKQVKLLRENSSGARGDLVINDGATLQASQSIVLDASHATTLNGSIEMDGGSLLMGANVINLGEVDNLTGNQNALNLSNLKLAKLKADELSLASRGYINIYGSLGLVSDTGLVPLSFNSLVIDAAGVIGHQSATASTSGDQVALTSKHLTLLNSQTQTPAAASADGVAVLTWRTDEFEQGKGAFVFDGFKQLDFTANQRFVVTDDSQLTLKADTTLNAAYLTALGGKTLNVNNQGYRLSIQNSGVSPSITTAGFAGGLLLTADSINFDSRALLYSGRLSLHALVGDVNVGSNAIIDLSGRAVSFADQLDYTPGGQLTAESDQGFVRLAQGSKVDLSTGGGNAAGGSLKLKAAKQSVIMHSQLQAKQGSASIDMARFDDSANFDQLSDLLQQAAINQAVAIRLREGDIVQSANHALAANQLNLSADQGSVLLAGLLDANGSEQGGSIQIYAADQIALQSGAQLTAKGAKGGKVLLSTTDDDQDGYSNIDLQAGSTIDVRGKDADNGGQVRLRALRTENGLSLQAVAGQVLGAKAYYAEAVRYYRNNDLGNDGQINRADIAAIASDTSGFMTDQRSQFVAALSSGLLLQPGVVISYSGDLSLSSPWDLVDWRYQNQAGQLVIKASGNLKIDQSLSDGFKTVTFGLEHTTKLIDGNATPVSTESDGQQTTINEYQNITTTTDTTWTIVDKLQTGPSWSYVLAAGADLGSVDSSRTAANGRLVIGSNAKVRTGTGDIGLNAGGDIDFTPAEAAVSATATFAANSNTMTVTDTTGLKVGAYLSGTGIETGTTIVSINNTPVVAKTASSSNKASVLYVADTTGWDVGAYVSGKGIDVDTRIVSIVNSAVVTKQVNAATKSNTLLVDNVSGWEVGAYVTGVNGIANGTRIVGVNDAAVVSKAVYALSGSSSLAVSDTSNWQVGSYLLGTGIATGTKITGINNTLVSKALAADTAKGATLLTVANLTDWSVGTYLSGTGLAAGTRITALKTAVAQTTSAVANKGVTSIKVGNVTGWSVGAYLSGTGIATGTKISAINTSTKTVTLSKATSAAMASSTSVSTLPTVTLSTASTAIVAANTQISTLASVTLSAATKAAITNQQIKTQATVELSGTTTAALTNAAITTRSGVELSKATTAAVASEVTTQPDIELSLPTLSKQTTASTVASYLNGMVYSAGEASSTAPFGSLSDLEVAKSFYVEYPVNGGDISLNAGGNINGFDSKNNFNDWLLRIGEVDQTSQAIKQPVAWGVALGMVATQNVSVQKSGYTQTSYTYTDTATGQQIGDTVYDAAQSVDSTTVTTVTNNASNINNGPSPLYQQNIGSFGGGKVNIQALGSVNQLEVAMPTTGKPVGDNANLADSSKLTSEPLSGFSVNKTEVNGGGDLSVNAGGDIVGGSYYVGKGLVDLTAAGQVTGTTAGSYDNHGPIIYGGDSQAQIKAGHDISLSGMFDPMVSGNSNVNFFSYSAASSLTLQSLAGDVNLIADNNLGANAATSNILPGSLNVTAFGGDFSLASDINLFPSAQGQLQLFAEQDISAPNDTAVFKLSMLDADVSLLPNDQSPRKNNDLADVANRLNPYSNDLTRIHAAAPVHSGDKQPVRVVSRRGSILEIGLNLPKQLWMSAGLDISNIALYAQNLTANDTTWLNAGRDLVFVTNRNPITGGLSSTSGETLSDKGIKVGGNGSVLITTGRNVDFGSSNGLVTAGNQYNPALAETGASINVLAGMAESKPDFAKFVARAGGLAEQADSLASAKALISPLIIELSNLPAARALLVDFVRQNQAQPGLTELEAIALLAADDSMKLAAFAALPSEYTLTTQFKLNALPEYQQIIAGLMQEPSYAALSQTQQGFIDLMSQTVGVSGLDQTQALQALAALSPEQAVLLYPQLNQLMMPSLFSLVKAAGSASAVDKTLGNQVGYAAISSLFPDSGQWQGDINLYFSKLQTLSGGDIQLLAPGGGVNAGLAVSVSGQKAAKDLGIVAQREGSINAVVRDDFLVNTSRVFTLGGGDIMIWSSEQDIDAGKGAKSAISAPPPIKKLVKGNLVVEFPPVVSGNGIRTGAPSGQKQGDVYLFAPKGVIDAGEAGIEGSKVTISATAVLGANNISFSTSSGVPTAPTGSVAAGLTGTSNVTAGVSQVAESSVNANAAKEAAKSLAKAVLGILSIDFLGFGD